MKLKNGKNIISKNHQQNTSPNKCWILLLCDFIIYIGTVAVLLLFDKKTDQLTSAGITQQIILSLICIFVMRIVFKSYDKIWKDREVKCNIHLLCADFIALIMYSLLVLLLPVEKIF